VYKCLQFSKLFLVLLAYVFILLLVPHLHYFSTLQWCHIVGAASRLPVGVLLVNSRKKIQRAQGIPKRFFEFYVRFFNEMASDMNPTIKEAMDK